jgi:hypothetical protein
MRLPSHQPFHDAALGGSTRSDAKRSGTGRQRKRPPCVSARRTSPCRSDPHTFVYVEHGSALGSARREADERLLGASRLEEVVCIAYWLTGAGGFIGHHLITYLKERRHWVRGVDHELPEFTEPDADEFEILDLRRRDDALVAMRGIDQVYALAADMGWASSRVTTRRSRTASP